MNIIWILIAWYFLFFVSQTHVWQTVLTLYIIYHGGLGDDVGEPDGDGKGDDLLGGTGGGGGGSSLFPNPGESNGDDLWLIWKEAT